MIYELFQYLTTRCPTAYRRMGYLKELIAIQARYKRVAPAWQSHIQQCDMMIRLVVEQCNSRHKVVVLGSGLLIDVPLRLLSEKFEQVVLIDLIELPLARRKASAFKNVKFISVDISGVIEALVSQNNSLGVEQQILPEPELSLPTEATDADLVISLNLLSQLPFAPLEYLQKYKQSTDEDLYNFGQKIILSHVSGLRELAAKVLLITDIEHCVNNLSERNENQSECKDALFDVELENIQDSWEWQVAPRGEIGKDFGKE